MEGWQVLTKSLPPVKLRKQKVIQEYMGWFEWFESYRLHNVVFGENANYLWYLKLSKVFFLVVPKELGGLGAISP